MRNFIGIDLPKDIKNYLFNLQNELKKELSAKIKWVSKKNLHITLKFIGELDKTKYDLIKDKLSKVNFKSFNLQLSSIGFFPNQKSPKILLVGLNECNKLSKLQKDIDSTLMNVLKDVQEFKTHITLGRIKLIKDEKSFQNLDKKHIEGKFFEVKSFSLFESKLSKDGSKYTILETYDV